MISEAAKKEATGYLPMTKYISTVYPNLIPEFMQPIWDKKWERRNNRRRNNRLEKQLTNSDAELYDTSMYLVPLFTRAYSKRGVMVTAALCSICSKFLNIGDECPRCKIQSANLQYPYVGILCNCNYQNKTHDKFCKVAKIAGYVPNLTIKDYRKDEFVEVSNFAGLRCY